MPIWKYAAPLVVACSFGCIAGVESATEAGGDLEPVDSAYEGIGASDETEDGLVPKAIPWFRNSFNAPCSGTGCVPGSLAFNFDVNDGFCLLAEVTGNFGSQGWSLVRLDSSNPKRWYGQGTGAGICTRWSNFIVPAGSQFIHPNGSTAAVVNANGTYSPSCRGSIACTTLFQGDGFSYINGVIGEMEGIGEYGLVEQATVYSSSNSMFAQGEAGYLRIEGFSAFAGIPQRQLVRLRGYNSAGQHITGNITTPGAVMTFGVSTHSGYAAYWMTDSAAGICGLTRVRGDFNDTGEKARIQEKTDSTGRKWWYLDTTLTFVGRVDASARCMAYDQR